MPLTAPHVYSPVIYAEFMMAIRRETLQRIKSTVKTSSLNTSALPQRSGPCFRKSTRNT